MELGTSVDGRGRLASAVLAVVLAVAAISSFRRGKRFNGVLAGAGAVALGYNATARSRNPTETIGSETASDDGELRCSVCGQPIRPGQRRTPTADNDVVHEACSERLNEH